MVSRADIPLPDPVAYRRDWRDWRVRLTFGTPPGELETLVDRRPRTAALISKAAPMCRGGLGDPNGRPVYGAACNVIDATPAATLSPVVPSMLSGCSAIVLLLPPTRALAPSPTPTVAPAVTPP